MRATRAIISTDNLRYNLDAIRRITGGVKQCLAVKADGYGHGAVGICEAAACFGVDYFAVAAVIEAEELRQNGITAPIIVLSPILPEETRPLAELNLEAVVSTEEEIKRLADAVASGSCLKIHLKIDTGMGRIGCRPENALKLAGVITETSGLTLAGVCTHFPVSDSCIQADIDYTRHQIRIFTEAVAKIREAGIDPGIIHAANSGAVLNYPESHFDMVRPGILAYGYLPGGEEGSFTDSGRCIQPKPVMSFESKLMHIKKVPAGTDISYGRRYSTSEETWIGTIPAGYADGYSRKLTNKAKILINGKLYPVAGTVCMDQLMVDLGPELKVGLYDRAVMFGSEKGAQTAADLTAITGTIPYELLCGISKRVPRIFD